MRPLRGLEDEAGRIGHQGESVVVLSLVGDDEHRRVVQRSLDVLPRRASSDATALVVSPVGRKGKNLLS